MSEKLPVQPHNYRFDADCHVDQATLHPLTIESLEQTNALYNANRSAYIQETYAVVSRTEEELPFAHFHQAGDSTTHIVLIRNPFGTPIAPRHLAEAMARHVDDRTATKTPDTVQPNDASKLLQGRFLYDTMRLAGITDPEGHPLSLVVTSSPSLDHTSPVAKAERKLISNGDFTPFALRDLKIVKHLGYGGIYAAGYSFGATTARAVELAASQDIDALAGCYVGDAPHFRKRHPRQPLPLGVLAPYMLDSLGAGYSNNWIDDGPEPRVDIARNGEGYEWRGHWFGNGNLKVNLAIGKGLSKDGLSDSLDFMDKHQIPTSIGYSESKLMRGFESYLTGSQSIRNLAAKGLLNLSVARKAPHISGENQVYLTDVMLRAILFARAAQ